MQSSSGHKSSSGKTASQPHLPPANTSAYNSADSDLGKAAKCSECQFPFQQQQQQQQHQLEQHQVPSSAPQPPSRRLIQTANTNTNTTSSATINTTTTTVGSEANIDRSKLHVHDGSRCSAQSSIDTDQGSVSTTGRESTTAADEEDYDFEGSVEVPSPGLPPPPPPLLATDLGTRSKLIEAYEVVEV